VGRMNELTAYPWPPPLYFINLRCQRRGCRSRKVEVQRLTVIDNGLRLAVVYRCAKCGHESNRMWTELPRGSPKS